MVYGTAGTTYTLTGVAPWTLGPGGSLGEVRPVRVEGAGLIRSGGCESPLPVLTLDQHRRQYHGLYIDSGYPLANVYVNPAPSDGEQLRIYAWTPIASFAHLDEAIDFAPGYVRALRWNLASELIPQAVIMAKIPMVLHAKVEANAAESKGWVKSLHSTPPPEMSAGDIGCGCGSYDISSDSWT